MPLSQPGTTPPPAPEVFNREPVSISPLLIPEPIYWPHRLLHVETMTSYARSGSNTYNGVSAPLYNIMSYTWGFYEDPKRNHPSLPVRGINWPIPSIVKEHLTSDMFLDAVRRVARGAYQEKCDWVWIDVACIPQKWAGETSEDAALRGQEIGRQVEIFQRAEEVFAWLCSIQEADIVKDHQDPVLGRVFAPYLTSTDIFNAASQVVFINERWQGLDELEAMTLAYERYMKRMLGHPYFQSLWTLQEMALRLNDSYILLDDDSLPEGAVDKQRVETHMSLGILTIESEAIELTVLPWLQMKVREMAATADPHDISSRPQHGQQNLEKIYQRLKDLASLQRLRGLNGTSITVPHTVYSAASLRRVKYLVDRIYGIVQVYGISCNPTPKGNDELAKLHALEDEFGKELVQKAPVLSQLFLHSSEDEAPRRSWLITQKCDAKLMGAQGNQFKLEDDMNTLFEVFKVLPGRDPGDLLLRFRGKAWGLGTFIEASAAAARVGKPELLFGTDTSSIAARKAAHRPEEDQYGLKLDYHISKSIFGRTLGNSPAYTEMHDAIFKHYNCPYIRGEERLGKIVVALLGSRWFWGHLNKDFVGLVLVRRDSGENKVNCHSHREDSLSASREVHSTGSWERIGLVVWQEVYDTCGHTPHMLLPPPYVFQCSIV